MDMDVSINPGPWKNEILSTGKPSYELSAMPPSCQITASRLYYSRDSLLRLSYYPKSVIETISLKIWKDLDYLPTEESVEVDEKQDGMQNHVSS